jgi:hypothetical protein
MQENPEFFFKQKEPFYEADVEELGERMKFINVHSLLTLTKVTKLNEGDGTCARICL